MKFYMSKIGRGRKVELVVPEKFDREGWQLHVGDETYPTWDAYQEAIKPKPKPKKVTDKVSDK